MHTSLPPASSHHPSASSSYLIFFFWHNDPDFRNCRQLERGLTASLDLTPTRCRTATVCFTGRRTGSVGLTRSVGVAFTVAFLLLLLVLAFLSPRMRSFDFLVQMVDDGGVGIGVGVEMVGVVGCRRRCPSASLPRCPPRPRFFSSRRFFIFFFFFDLGFGLVDFCVVAVLLLLVVACLVAWRDWVLPPLLPPQLLFLLVLEAEVVLFACLARCLCTLPTVSAPIHETERKWRASRLRLEET